MKTADHYEGIMSLVQMAVATAMEKAGLKDLHISREDLATAFDRLHITFSNGVADGMRFHVEPKSFQSTDGAPPETSTSYKPAALALDEGEVEFLAARLRRLFNHFKYPLPNWAADDKHLIGIAPSCIGGVLANLTADQTEEQAEEQAARWRALCEYTFGEGAHLAANIEENMRRLVSLNWDKAEPAPAPAIRTVVDCGYCHGEGYLLKGMRKRECPDCHGAGTVEADA